MDAELAPKDLGLIDRSKIFILGTLSTNIENIGSAVALKFFKRFRDSRNDGWYIGRDRWDAVTFAPRRDVRICGAGIYEPYPQSSRTFKYGYKYVIQENGSDLITS